MSTGKIILCVCMVLPVALLALLVTLHTWPHESEARRASVEV